MTAAGAYFQDYINARILRLYIIFAGIWNLQVQKMSIKTGIQGKNVAEIMKEKMGLV